MRNTMLRATALAVIAALLPASVALAGQVRIDVSNGVGANQFVPSTRSLNLGDQVTWVWISGSHSVTNGTPCSVAPSPAFNAPQTSRAASGTAFTWKSTLAGNVPFFCIPHCLSGMTGSLTVNASGTPVADFRITEVQYNLAGGLDLIEIANLGGADGDLGRFRIVTSTDSATVPLDTWSVSPGTRVTIHANASGAQSPPGVMFLPTLQDLPNTSGSLAIYAPNTFNAAFTDASQIVDYFEWGAGGQANEGTAATAGLWTAGQFLTTLATGHSNEFCGTAADHGAGNWAEISVPNFGSNGNCTTPTIANTWGRIKTLYR